MTQLEYAYQINQFSLNGIPFNEHLYIPEIHPTTWQVFCERKGETPVSKVCGHIF